MVRLGQVNVTSCTVYVALRYVTVMVCDTCMSNSFYVLRCVMYHDIDINMYVCDATLNDATCMLCCVTLCIWTAGRYSTVFHMGGGAGQTECYKIWY